MTKPRSTAHSPIAIVGMSGRFPGARDLDAFWANLRGGVESLDTFSDAELAAAGVDRALSSRADWVRRGTVLEDADYFDASFFGYSPREAQIIDPQQRVFLETAWEALENAGYVTEPDDSTIGVFAGSSMPTYIISQLLADPDLIASVGGYQLMLGNDKDFLTTRVSYKLDLQGPSMVIQTACSTSLVAVQVAVRSLQRGECDMALAGGVSINFPQGTGYQYQEGMIFSPDATCRPFDKDAHGTRGGAGVGIVVLKRLDEALADRDTIHAVILGAAINNDGAAKAGYTAPSVDGQVDAIATAQALSGIDVGTIGYVEAHGTGTPLGDPIEIAALTRAFRARTEAREFCAIGSVKANIGHLDAAAGVAGLIKATLALEHEEIPPLVHFKSANPQLSLSTSPFRVPTESEPWKRRATPRRAAVSSFGIGGTNAHVVLEEAPARAPTMARHDRQLLVLSAKTAEGLEHATKNLVAYLRAHPDASLANVAYTLQVGRRAFRHRRAVAVREVSEAIDALSQPERPPVITSVHEGSARPVAFLFSGQGSQHSGMGRTLYATEPVFRDAFDRCADLLKPHLDRDLRELRDCGADVVDQTRYAQPLLFATEYSLATLWMAWGIEPRAMLGHSIGEYVAAHLAGVLSLDDVLMLVAARGRLMQSALPGDMLAVNLSADELRRRLTPGVEIAAVNAPALCTVSGEREAIAAFAGQLANAGVEHRMLHTSHAFHSAMMEPVLASFREIVATVRLSAPKRRYLSNVTGTWILPEQATAPEYYAQHLRGAVQFAAGVEQLAAEQCVLLEVGPGNALTSLARLTLGRDASARAVASLPHPKEARGDVETVFAALGRMWTLGASMDWDGLHADEQLGRIPLPTYPFERKRHWVEARRAAGQAIAMPNPETQSVAAAIAAERRPTLDEWFQTESWLRSPMPTSKARFDGATWLVFGGQSALTSDVRDRLAGAGANVVLVERGERYERVKDEQYTVRPLERSDYDALLRDLHRHGARLSGVMHLWNVDAASHDTAHARDPFHSLVALGGALEIGASSDHLQLIVATRDAQSVNGERISRPEIGMLAGVTLVLPEERPGVVARLVDLELVGEANDAALAAEQLLEEARAMDGESVVARRAGQRWLRRYVPATVLPAERSGLPVRDGGAYLITGGLGAIGLTLAEWLARETSARLLLTSRSAMPARETWDAWLESHDASDSIAERIVAIRRIEAAGGEVRVAVGDAADSAAMAEHIHSTEREWGPIVGVIHAAGIPDAEALASATVASTDALLQAKVGGLDVLVALLGDHSLDFVVLVSSINAMVGNAGAAAYTAANAYFDAFATSSHVPASWNTLSIAFDAWSEIGMATKVVVAEAMREARQTYVAAGIPPREGAESVARMLASGLRSVLVSPFDVERTLGRRRKIAAGNPSPRSVAEREVRVAPRAGTASPYDGDAGIEAQLAAVWSELLGVEAIGLDQNFFELGGHSLLATRVLARVLDMFGVQVPLRTLFEAPTIRQFAVVVASLVEPAEVAADGDREEIEL
jgi:phthiocerol/phenolphthiocerol synthesis type-I polyketide synthase E